MCLGGLIAIWIFSQWPNERVPAAYEEKNGLSKEFKAKVRRWEPNCNRNYCHYCMLKTMQIVHCIDGFIHSVFNEYYVIPTNVFVYYDATQFKNQTGK